MRNIRQERGIWDIRSYAAAVKDIKRLSDEKKWDEALRYLSQLFSYEPSSDPILCYLAGLIFASSGKNGMATVYAEKAVAGAPNRSEAWHLLGHCLVRPDDYEQALECYMKALSIDPTMTGTMLNISNTYLQMSEPWKVLEWTDSILSIAEEHTSLWYGAKDNSALAHLMLGDWERGWDNYIYMLGRKQRKEVQYNDEPRWDGEKGQKVIVTGEQGLGDELLFSSCIPDLIEDSKRVVIDCDPRLKGLFKRSFEDPNPDKVKVYGTRMNFKPEWDSAKDLEVDAHSAMGTLPKFYRRRDEEFPGEPWLKACPIRRRMYRAALDEMSDKPKIGIAWVGGWKLYERPMRTIPLEDLDELLAKNYDFIDLEYLDPTEEIAECDRKGYAVPNHWPWATMTKDYDDTAALVAELDLVICVATSVCHLAGSLGVPNWVLVPQYPNWRFMLNGDTLPWHRTTKLYRQARGEPWANVLDRLGGDLDEHFCRSGHEAVAGFYSLESQYLAASAKSARGEDIAASA